MLRVSQLMEVPFSSSPFLSGAVGVIAGALLTQAFTWYREERKRVIDAKSESYLGALETQKDFRSLVSQIDELNTAENVLDLEIEAATVNQRHQEKSYNYYLAPEPEFGEPEEKKRLELMAAIKSRIDEHRADRDRYFEERIKVRSQIVEMKLKIEERRQSSSYWYGRLALSASKDGIRALEFLQKSGPQNYFAYEQYIRAARRDLATTGALHRPFVYLLLYLRNTTSNLAWLIRQRFQSAQPPLEPEDQVAVELEPENKPIVAQQFKPQNEETPPEAKP